jgi:non-ribosomal peptide synthetase component F
VLSRRLHRVNILRSGDERHFVFFTFCHRLIDGIGIEKVFREIGLAYQAMVNDEEPDLGEPVLQDRDYSEWLKTWSVRQHQSLEAYWTERFRDGIPVSPMPLGIRDSSTPTGRSRLQYHSIDADLIAGMRRLAEDRGTTVYFVHLAAMALVLHRWTGLQDILLNSVVDMRLPPEASDLVGNFVSAVPIRVKVDGAQGLGEFLDDMVKLASEALDHRGFDCRRHFRPMLEKADRIDSPFGSCFCSQAPDTVSSLNPSAAQLKPIPRAVMHGTHFACNLHSSKDGGGRFHFEYPEGQFTPSAIQKLANAYLEIVASMINSPEGIIRDLATIAVEVAGQKSVPQEESSEGIPRLRNRGPVALPLKAAEAWRRNNLGQDRFPLGITRAFRLDGVFDLDAYHQALKVVIGRHETLRVMHRCLDDGGVERVILDDYKLDIRFVDLGGESREVALERARQIFDQESVEPLKLTEGLPCRFCVVRISDTVHVAVLTFCHLVVDGIGLSIVFEELGIAYAAISGGRKPRLPAVKVQSLDYSSWLKTWLEANKARLESFWKNLFDEGIPRVHPPLAGDPVSKGPVPGLLLRINLPADLMNRVEKRARYHGVSRFQFLYAGAFVMFARDPNADVTMISTITNARRHPDAETVVGEFIEGIPVLIRPLQGMQVGAAIEYIGARVGEAFAHSMPGTVGLGRQILEKQGREDAPFGLVYFNQVPDIESAFCLVGLEIEPWNRKHILMGSNLGITARTLRDGSTVIQSTCPAALLPEQDGARLLERYRDTITWMLDHPQEEIAETENTTGELLAARKQERSVIGDRPDRNRTLEGVSRIYEESLGRPVGADAAFFGAGGDSLMAARVLHRVNREFRVNLSFAAFEKDTTARQLVEKIELATRSAPATDAKGSARNLKDEAYQSLHPPLVLLPRPIPRTLIPEPPQEGVRRAYGERAIVCRGFEVGRGFDPEIFEKAFTRVVARHDALRRCYRRDRQDRVWCAVRDDPKLNFEVIDLGDLSGREADLRISEIYASESRRTLKPFSGAMHRVKIFRVATDRTVIIFTFSHRFVDGVSLVNILSETGRAYQALAGGRKPSLPPVLVQEPDYKAWLDQWEEINQERLEGFWRQVFRDGFPPRPFKRPEIGTGRKRINGRFLNFSVPAEEIENVRAFASVRKSSPHYVFLAAYCVFFNRWLGLDDILASSVRDLRMLPEVRDVVGNFISNTPVRVRISEADSLDQVVNKATRIGRDAMAHSTPRIGKIILKLLNEAGLSENPLYSILINQVPDTYGALQLGDIPVRPLLREVVGDYAVASSHRFKRDGSVGFQVAFPIHLISAEEFGPLLKDYRTILSSIISSPETRVGELQKIGQNTKLG